MTPTEALAGVRECCAELPQVVERLSHGAPSFFVAGKACMLMFHDNHHNDGRLAVWVAAPVGVQATMVELEPSRFFVPPYVGGRGWLGVRLERDVDWQEMRGIVRDAFLTVAPPKVRQLLT